MGLRMREGQILIVDDDEKVRGLFTDGMAELGYRVSTAADGGAAISVLRQQAFDAVVLDLQMSPVGGWEVLKHLRERLRETQVLLLSAYVDVPLAVSAMRAGAFDVLEKPIRLTELASRVEDALIERRERAGDSDRQCALKPFRNDVQSRVAFVRSKPQVRRGAERLLGDSGEISRIREQLVSLARFKDVSTLIIGETGTGKEVVAAAIHELSAVEAPFVSINCAAIPEELFESELFGHESGAFTGARGAHSGLLETVQDGTLFLDEVGEMPARLQPKFLRVLQTRKFRRIGGKHELDLRARVVSATNRKLTAAEQDGLRADLYFRLAGFTISLPPLRKRMSDLDALATSFLLDFAERYPGSPTRFDDSAADALLAYSWPGNVRELRTVMEQAAMLSRHGTVDKEAVLAAFRQGQLPFDGSSIERLRGLELRLPEAEPVSAVHFVRKSADSALGLNDIQRQITLEVFEQHAGNLARAARQLRIPRTTLRDRLRRYGVL